MNITDRFKDNRNNLSITNVLDVFGHININYLFL